MSVTEKQELQAKIENYKKQIKLLEVDAEPEDLRKIRDYNERIVRLEERIAEIPDTNGPTQAQIDLIEYVNSPAYDEE